MPAWRAGCVLKQRDCFRVWTMKHYLVTTSRSMKANDIVAVDA